MSHLKTRRTFIREAALGTALSATVPAFLARTFSALGAEAARAGQPASGRDNPVLVVLQLAGGNDGLNTVVPVSNDFYHKARPGLGIKAGSLKLNDDFALHPALTGFKDLYDAGQLSIIHGVGYPNPNRSHFRSTEIWQTASEASRYEKYGWLGRYFDHACQGADPVIGVNIGRQMPQAFAGPRPLGISLENPESYRVGAGEDRGDGEFMSKLNSPSAMEEAEANSGTTIGSVPGTVQSGLSPLDYLERTALDARVSSETIRKVSRAGKNQVTYPASALANSLKLVARLIGGGLSTRVYYVLHGGFDTHTNQAAAHERLLRDLGSSVKAFTDDLKAQGNADRVLIMTFSEFGRRLAQNANGGTDHGAAAPLFMIGPKIKAGLIGQFPSLAPADLLNGDPKYTTDFRAVYAGVLEGWLKTNAEAILGRKVQPVFPA